MMITVNGFFCRLEHPAGFRPESPALPVESALDCEFVFGVSGADFPALTFEGEV